MISTGTAYFFFCSKDMEFQFTLNPKSELNLTTNVQWSPKEDSSLSLGCKSGIQTIKKFRRSTKALIWFSEIFTHVSSLHSLFRLFLLVEQDRLDYTNIIIAGKKKIWTKFVRLFFSLFSLTPLLISKTTTSYSTLTSNVKLHCLCISILVLHYSSHHQNFNGYTVLN